MPSKGRRPHYGGTHQRAAKKLCDAAYADPTTQCPTCGLTLEERRRTHPTAIWDAGHMLDGVKGSPLIAQCSHCNRSQGIRKLNTMRMGGYDW